MCGSCVRKGRRRAAAQHGRVAVRCGAACSRRGAPVRLCSAAPRVERTMPTLTTTGCGHDTLAARMKSSLARAARSATSPYLRGGSARGGDALL